MRRGVQLGSTVAAALLFGGVTGCEIDCQDQYCKFVQAGQTGVFAYHYMCCMEPEAETCDEYAARIHRFSQDAADMYLACERRDWERLGAIWNEIKSLLPIGVVAIIADNFCDGYGWTARNRWSPFGGGDTVEFDVSLGATAPRIRVDVADRDTGSTRKGPASVVVVRDHRTTSPGEVVFDLDGDLRRFDFEGGIRITDQADRSSIRAVDVSPWCRSLRIEALDWTLRSDACDVVLSLVDDASINRIHTIDEGRFVLSALVRLDFVQRFHSGLELDGTLDEVVFEIPCDFDDDGSLRLVSGIDMSTMRLWPVDPGLERFLLGQSSQRSTVDAEHDECVRQAIQMADYFRSLHDCP